MRHTRGKKWQGATLAGMTVVVMLAAACGPQDEKPKDDGAAQPAAGTSAPNDTGGTTAVTPQQKQTRPAGQLTIWQNKKLGAVLTDSAGFTLYRFDNDKADPATSNCADDCAKTWPPVPADGVSVDMGIAPEALGEITRADGTRQLTVGDWPVYRYSKDTEPRQTNGQAVGGTWFASAPDGAKAGGGKDAGDQGNQEDQGGQEDQGDRGNQEGQYDQPAGTGQSALSVFQDPKLGKLVRDGQGRTLYRFSKDTPWPMRSNCLGDCLKTWRPAEPPEKSALSSLKGVDPRLLGVLKRPDGTEQLSIDCWPVYWFTGDKQPGDTNGQGVNNAWFAVRPDGGKAGASRR